jgi:hypothetical protein
MNWQANGAVAESSLRADSYLGKIRIDRTSKTKADPLFSLGDSEFDSDFEISGQSAIDLQKSSTFRLLETDVSRRLDWSSEQAS